jgi:hypothetical protein
VPVSSPLGYLIIKPLRHGTYPKENELVGAGAGISGMKAESQVRS